MGQVIQRFFCSVSFPREIRVWSLHFTLLYIFLCVNILYFLLIKGLMDNQHLDYDEGQTTIITKVRGVAYTNFPEIPALNGRVWDAADYVEPPLENGAKFIMTNMVITPRQIQGVCEEDPSVLDAVCNASHPCQPGRAVQVGHGVMTGNCVDSTRAPGTKVCAVRAWCPVERDDNTTHTAIPAFLESENFTLFIRHTVRFPYYNKIRLNIPSYAEDDQTSCQYDPDHSEYQHCPVFRIGKIVELAGYSFQDVAEKGGVFQVSISWECDGSDLDNCWPKYNFTRLDGTNSSGICADCRGFRFRYADHWQRMDGTLERTLYKAIGIRLIFTSEATAYRFNRLKLVFAVGSMIGWLQVAGFVTQFLVSCFMQKYDGKKYEEHHLRDSIDVLRSLRTADDEVQLCCAKSTTSAESSTESTGLLSFSR